MRKYRRTVMAHGPFQDGSARWYRVWSPRRGDFKTVDADDFERDFKPVDQEGRE